MQSAQPYIHLNPKNPRDSFKGSLDPLMLPDGIPLEDDDLDFGEVEISSDGLLHSETACRSSLAYEHVNVCMSPKITTTVPRRLGNNQSPSCLIMFAQIDWFLKFCMDGLNHWGYWPEFYSVPEQHHIWPMKLEGEFRL